MNKTFITGTVQGLTVKNLGQGNAHEQKKIVNNCINNCKQVSCKQLYKHLLKLLQSILQFKENMKYINMEEQALLIIKKKKKSYVHSNTGID